MEYSRYYKRLFWIENVFEQKFDWNYEKLIKNENLTLELYETIIRDILEKRKQIPNKFPSNPNVSLEFLEKYPDLLYLTRELSKSENITMEMVKANPNINWNCSYLCENPNITMEIIKSYLKKFLHRNIDWEKLSKNVGITMEIIDAHPEYKWKWYLGVSRNPNLTIDFVKKYSKKRWNWSYISQNPNITIETIRKFPDSPWVVSNLFFNPNFTFQNICEVGMMRGINVAGNRHNMLCLPMKFPIKNMETFSQTDLNLLSLHGLFTGKDIQKYGNILNLTLVSRNKHMTKDILKSLTYSIKFRRFLLDWEKITENIFNRWKTSI